MSCQQVAQLSSSVIGTTISPACPVDPYVFTEPPSIQDLQYYKLAAKSHNQSQPQQQQQQQPPLNNLFGPSSSPPQQQQHQQNLKATIKFSPRNGYHHPSISLGPSVATSPSNAITTTTITATTTSQAKRKSWATGKKKAAQALLLQQSLTANRFQPPLVPQIQTASNTAGGCHSSASLFKAKHLPSPGIHQPTTNSNSIISCNSSSSNSSNSTNNNIFNSDGGGGHRRTPPQLQQPAPSNSSSSSSSASTTTTIHSTIKVEANDEEAVPTAVNEGARRRRPRKRNGTTTAGELVNGRKQTASEKGVVHLKVNGSGGKRSGAGKRDQISWHAPHSYIFDISDNNNDRGGGRDPDNGVCHIRHWFLVDGSDHVDDLQARHNRPASTWNGVQQRDERLEVMRAQLRRKSMQLREAQKLRFVGGARSRFNAVKAALERGSLPPVEKRTAQRLCGWEECKNEALLMTAYCRLHITQDGEQLLFAPCTAKFADNRQCRVPVFDISHELPLCPKHAWKRDNYQRMIPKRSAATTMSLSPLTMSGPTNVHQQQSPQHQKMPKLSAMSVRSSPAAIQQGAQRKLGGGKPQPIQNRFDVKHRQHDGFGDHVDNDEFEEDMDIEDDETDDLMGHEGEEEDSLLNNKRNFGQKRSPVCGTLRQQQQQLQQRPVIRAKKGGGVLVGTTPMGGAAIGATNLTSTADLFMVCENSSAYESSEDTGVGGLSESELIEEIGLDSRLLEMDPELNNVLNQFPEADFSELFSVQHSDQEVFDGVLEVDDEVKTMETSTYLGDFLADHVLEETVISSAATTNGGGHGMGGDPGDDYANDHHHQQQHHHSQHHSSDMVTMNAEHLLHHNHLNAYHQQNGVAANIQHSDLFKLVQT